MEFREPGEWTSQTPPGDSPSQPEPYTDPDEDDL